MKIFVMLGLLFSTSAFAFPKAPFDAFKFNPAEFAEQHQFNTLSQNYDFEAIVKLNNCSGSLIQFAGQPESTNAYVLTNGHCLSSFVPPGEARINKASQRIMKVADKNKRFHSIQAQRLVYGTMTGTDSAIYELNETYAQIKERTGVRPLLLAYQHPMATMGIDIVSGYWERGYRCSIDKFIYLLSEGGWMFSDSIKYTQPGCDTIGGTSGSPIVVTGTRFVVGVNNTGNNDGEQCSLNNPCEIDPQGKITVEQGASYGQQTYIFYYCLTQDFQIDPNLSSCPLVK